ncbi:MAG TPA: amidohydrolase/deacetylase family metallohydrolase [Candidatus Tectomicrobia bacterium]|nr:amidohydrolase/deacetylase family metallohydrolase [Candidatus Tectomicrobia bacterium]
MADVLIRGGEVLDPGQGLRGRLDVLVSQGRITRIASQIDPGEADRVVDVSGKLVAPGLIDLHAHVYAGVRTVGVNENCLRPDLAGVQSGVTTLVDPGSGGCYNFSGFTRFLVPSSRTRLFALVNIARHGLFGMPEITQRDDIDLEGTIKCVEQNKPTVLGIKLRMAGPVLDIFGIEAAKLAKRAARETGTRLMVHIGDSREERPHADRLTQQLLAEVLDAGDIVTHLCTHHAGGVMRQDGTVIPELRDAVGAGVVLDPAHGRFNFNFDIARRQLDQGIMPDTISTDIGLANWRATVHSMTETMSKFLSVGLSLEDVILRTTANPAKALGMADTLGAIAVGREADLSVLDVVDGQWEFTDSSGAHFKGKQAIVPVVTIRAGEVIAPDWGPHPWGWLPAPGPVGRR